MVDAQEAGRRNALMLIEAAQRAGHSEAEIAAIVEQDHRDDLQFRKERKLFRLFERKAA
jgi:hypothetical protein